MRTCSGSTWLRIIDEGRRSITGLLPERRLRVCLVRGVGVQVLTSSWKNWPCLFPQHGPAESTSDRSGSLTGRRRSSVDPRYQFSNVSADIRDIFCWACDLLGVEWKQSRWNTISVSKRRYVHYLDTFIGPKG